MCAAVEGVKSKKMGISQAFCEFAVPYTTLADTIAGRKLKNMVNGAF